MHVLFHGASRLLEPIFHLNHIFVSLGDWFYLRGVRRRPTILTVAAQGPPVHCSLLERVDCFVVEFEAAREQLIQRGIPRQRIRMIFPAADLTRFIPTNPPEGPFTVLFASSPELSAWLGARGLPILLDAAALRPEMRFRLIWRPWGDSLPTIRSLVRERGLANVEIISGRFADMPRWYQAAHVTVAPFTEIERCKPMPNSLVESLACGRPVLMTPEVGLAGMVRESRSGVVVAPDGESIAEGLDRLRSDWGAHSEPARRLAVRWFSTGRFLEGYHRTYDELTRHRPGGPPPDPARSRASAPVLRGASTDESSRN